MPAPIVAAAWAGAKAATGWVARRQAMRLAGQGLRYVGRTRGARIVKKGGKKTWDAVRAMENNPATRYAGRKISPATRQVAKLFRSRIKYSKNTRTGRLMRKANAWSTNVSKKGIAVTGMIPMAMLDYGIGKAFPEEPDSDFSARQEAGLPFASESGAMGAVMTSGPQTITDVYGYISDEALGDGGLGATGVNWAGAYKKKRRQRKAAASMAKLRAKGDRRRRLRKLARSRVRALAQARRAGRRGVRRA